jgi:hypothetical protein
MELSSWEFSRQLKSICHQKKIIRIMAGGKRRVSLWELFKKCKILLLAIEILLSLLSFVVDIMEMFQTNLDIHNVNTRQHDVHQPTATLTSYQKGAYYASVFFQIALKA